MHIELFSFGFREFFHVNARHLRVLRGVKSLTTETLDQAINELLAQVSSDNAITCSPSALLVVDIVRVEDRRHSAH